MKASSLPLLLFGRGKVNTAIADFYSSCREIHSFEEVDGELLGFSWEAGAWKEIFRQTGNFESVDWSKRGPAEVFLSPGIDPRRSFFQALLKQESRELDLFYESFKGRIIGITGSNGKSSVTTWIGESFQKTLGPERVFVGGNLGRPSLEALKSSYDWAVLELSSYQLERLKSFRCDYGILLNLSPDHLDRYDSLEQYYAQKWRLLERATHSFCPQEEDPPHSISGLQKIHSSLEAMSDITTKLIQKVGEIESISFVPPSMKALEHRMQRWVSPRGVRYINDSKATNEASMLYALRLLSQEERGPLYWIVGGKDKGADYRKALPYLREGDSILAYGASRERIQRDLEANFSPFRLFSSLRELMNELPRELPKEALVLLSPGSSSFDEFENFEDRGRCFLQWAKDVESSLFF